MFKFDLSTIALTILVVAIGINRLLVPSVPEGQVVYLPSEGVIILSTEWRCLDNVAQRVDALGFTEPYITDNYTAARCRYEDLTKFN